MIAPSAVAAGGGHEESRTKVGLNSGFGLDHCRPGGRTDRLPGIFAACPGRDVKDDRPYYRVGVCVVRPGSWAKPSQPSGRVATPVLAEKLPHKPGELAAAQCALALQTQLF